jgi:hypothetical protein
LAWICHHARHTSKRKRERPKHLYQTARNLSAWHLTLDLRASAGQGRNTTPSPLPPAECKRPGKLTPEAWGSDPAGSLLTRSPTRRVGVPSCLRSAGAACQASQCLKAPRRRTRRRRLPQNWRSLGTGGSLSGCFSLSLGSLDGRSSSRPVNGDDVSG